MNFINQLLLVPNFSSTASSLPLAFPELESQGLPLDWEVLWLFPFSTQTTTTSSISANKAVSLSYIHVVTGAALLISFKNFSSASRLG